MYFRTTDEQRALSRTVRDYLRSRFDLGAVREVFEDPAGDGHPEGLWSAAAEQGWLAVLVPESADGLGLGLLDAALIAERLGAGCAPGPWHAAVVGGEALRLAGGGETDELLARVATGEVVVAAALHSRGEPWDAEGSTVELRDGALHGEAHAVQYAHVADHLVVLARDGDRPALVLVDAGADGLEVRRLEALDGTTRLCDVVLDGVRGTSLPGADRDVVEDLLRRAALLTAADLTGLAREALTRTVDYDKTREQFGRPVGSFQAIKHHLADLHVAVTMAEHGVRYAAHMVDTGSDEAELMASVAKAKASDTAREVVAAMIQYFGGIGYTWEHEAHFFFKRAKREEYEYGDGAEHRERVARLLVDRPVQDRDAPLAHEGGTGVNASTAAVAAPPVAPAAA